jgi:hypothetical protein
MAAQQQLRSTVPAAAIAVLPQHSRQDAIHHVSLKMVPPGSGEEVDAAPLTA